MWQVLVPMTMTMRPGSVTVTAGTEVNCNVTFYNTGSGIADYVRYKF